jgi:hypothetical protein
MSHPVGVGNAKHRFPHYEGLAEGACFPMFRTEAFERVGLYDEALIRNQDDELNLRVEKAGGKVFLSPRARCEYYVRETPAALFRQYFQYGYWRVAVLRKHRMPASWRQIAPVTFFVVLIAAASAGWFISGGSGLITAFVLPIAYASVLLGVGVRVATHRGFAEGLLFPAAAAIMHLAYASGFALACLSIRKSGGRRIQTAISR